MPIFFGDDTTDDDGFRVLKDYGGVAVVVGHRRPPEAEYTVKDPTTMRQLLSGLKLAA
jgi:trehalose 6-phosphate phosphatase